MSLSIPKRIHFSTFDAMIKEFHPIITDPWNFFRALSAREPHSFYFDNWGDAGITYFGIAPDTIIQGRANETPEKVYERINSLLTPSGTVNTFPFESGVVGLMGYNLCAEFEEYPKKKEYDTQTPDFHFGVYSTIYIFEHETGRFYISTKKDEIHEPKIEKKDINDAWSAENFSQVAGKQEYESYVKKTVHYIHAGDVFQANLAHPIQFDFSGDPAQLFESIRKQNPSPYNAYYNTPEFTVVSNSPELLYSVRGRHVKTKPIAGTRPRGKNADDEALLKEELFISEKERAEHLMLVDLERNDLGRFCTIGSVVVEKFMDCEGYQDVMHIVSTVTGTANETITAPEMLQHLFPGGTITGAPKIRSIEIIDELEESDRKFYTGSLGFFDHNGDCETSILIRTLLLQGSKGEMHFGAGIVADSVPEKEYDETMHKAASWMKLLTKER